MTARVPDDPAERTRSRPPGAVLAVPIAVAVVAFAVRLAVLLHTDGPVTSAAYDDGVYYAAADSLVHGRWPYRDFLLLQPPAAVLALTPFAGLGALIGDPAGVLIARLVWIGIGATSCAIIAVLAGRRSTAAGLVAGAFAACFFPLAYGERSTLLEPVATLLLLASVLVGERGGRLAPVVAGVLAGLTVDVKIWYVVPVLVLLVFTRSRLRFLLGAVGGALVLVAPFLIAAPQALVEQVLLDQLGRPRLADDTTITRLTALTGSRYLAAPDDLPVEAALPIAIVIVLVVIAAAVVAVRSSIGRRAVALALATNVVLLASPSFFVHYAAYEAPWVAIVLGLGAAALAARVRGRAVRAAAVAALTALVAAPTLGRDLQPPAPDPGLAPLAAAAQRVEGCVRADDPALLAALDVLSRDLARGCTVWPDVTGWTYTRPEFPTISDERAGSPAWQAFVNRYLLGGAAVVVHRQATGLSDGSRRRIDRLPELARSGRLVLHAVPG